MISLVFVGTSEFSVQCLSFLPKTDFQVKAVITRPDRPHSRGLRQTGSPVKIFSVGKGLPLYQPETFTPAFIRKTAGLKCDLALVCAYGQILPGDFFKAFPKGAVNVHPSLLPRWRGAAPIERALMAGDTKSGVCLQVMVEQMDAGDIISCEEFPIEEEDTAVEVYQKSARAAKKLLRETLVPYIKKQIQPVPQKGEVTFAGKIQKAEGCLQWEKPARALHNQVRALTKGPQAFSFLRGKRIKIIRSRPLSVDFLPAGGTVLNSGGGELRVACGQGALSLLEVQRPGRKKQTAEEFLRGFLITGGEVFHSSP